MPYRGRLLFPLLAELQQLDTDATRSAGGYDAVWRTPTTRYDGDVRSKGQVYKAAIRLRCQIEPAQDNAQQRAPMGNVPDSRMALVFHFADLEAAGLVDASGSAMIRVNDKLVAMYQVSGQLIKTMTPELYATEVLNGGLGLGGNRNLAVVTFEDRPQGVA